jgi:hypothetical protein
MCAGIKIAVASNRISPDQDGVLSCSVLGGPQKRCNKCNEM